MLPGFRVVVVTVISTFLFAAGVGFYTSSRLMQEQSRGRADILASRDDNLSDRSPVDRIALSWPEPLPQTQALDLDFAVTNRGARNPVRDVTENVIPPVRTAEAPHTHYNGETERLALEAPQLIGPAPSQSDNADENSESAVAATSAEPTEDAGQSVPPPQAGIAEGAPEKIEPEQAETDPDIPAEAAREATAEAPAPQPDPESVPQSAPIVAQSTDQDEAAAREPEPGADNLADAPALAEMQKAEPKTAEAATIEAAPAEAAPAEAGPARPAKSDMADSGPEPKPESEAVAVSEPAPEENVDATSAPAPDIPRTAAAPIEAATATGSIAAETALSAIAEPAPPSAAQTEAKAEISPDSRPAPDVPENNADGATDDSEATAETDDAPVRQAVLIDPAKVPLPTAAPGEAAVKAAARAAERAAQRAAIQRSRAKKAAQRRTVRPRPSAPQQQQQPPQVQVFPFFHLFNQPQAPAQAPVQRN